MAEQEEGRLEFITRVVSEVNQLYLTTYAEWCKSQHFAVGEIQQRTDYKNFVSLQEVYDYVSTCVHGVQSMRADMERTVTRSMRENIEQLVATVRQ